MKLDNVQKIIMIDALIGNEYSSILCSTLHKGGIHVTLVVPANKNFENIPEFKVLPLLPSKDPNDSKIKKVRDYINYFLIIAKIAVKERAVVHFQFIRLKFEILFILLLKLLGVHIVYTAHNVLPHEPGNLDPLIFNTIYKTVNRIIVHSNSIKQKLLKNFSISEKKIHIIPHGSFDDLNTQMNLTQKTAREYFSLNEEDCILLFFGYIRDYKGLDLLIQAFDLLTKHPDYKLLIAGAPATDHLLDKYQSMIQKALNKKNIIPELDFIPTDKIAYYFNAADLIVLPYKKIDHSGIVHLAYSFAKPVLATPVGDFKEMIHPGKTGFLTSNQSPEELADMIRIAFKDNSKLKQMGKNARSFSETHFSWNSIAQKTISLYQSLSKK